MTEQSSTLQDSFSRFGELMQDPQFFNEDWTYDVAFELVIWQTTYDEAKAMAPPSRFVEMHGVYVEALRHFAESTDLIASGIDSLDVDLINQATEKITTGTALLEEATAMLGELT